MPQNILARYSIESYDPSGNLMGDLTGIVSVQGLLFERNRSPSATLSADLFKMEDYAKKLNINPLDLLNVNRSEIRVRRYDKYLFAGQVSNIEPQISGDQATIAVGVSGWLDLLGQRYTGNNEVFSSVDAGAIAWDLIEDSQALTHGNLGITSGLIQTSVNRDRTYNGKNIKDALIELSEVINGFDFEITWDKKFNVYYPYQGMDRSADLRFEYKNNIKSIDVPRDGTKMINYVIARGAGQGDAQISDTEQDTASQTTYGLRQSILDYPDVIEAATLAAHANGQIASYKNIIDMPVIVLNGSLPPALGSYWLGDQIILTVPDLQTFSYLKDVKYKIDKISVKVDAEEQEEVELSLSVF
jgi:hypothetical protein